MTVNTFPLLKTKLSNERLMSALLLVLVLYNLPRFIAAPDGMLFMLLLVVIGLVLDAAIHFFIYRRPVCAVSAAVTALILYSLSPGAPFWAICLSLIIALIIGKALWGGTGKNLFNPAMLGLAFLFMLTPLKHPPFEPTFFLLPALLLSLPFLCFRPYAGFGMIAGMLASSLFNQTLTPGAVISGGVFFYGCLVITDPVTTTSKPAAGLVIGLLAGFISSLSSMPVWALPICILVSNLLSFAADRLNFGPNDRLKMTFGAARKIKLSDGNATDIVHTGAAGHLAAGINLSSEEILNRIEKNKVFGMGGAAFPSWLKIKTVMESGSPDKHLIINAVECDPGLIHDNWLLKQHQADIQAGIDCLTRCVSFSSVSVAAKDFDGTVFSPPVRMHKVKDYYPAGAEKILIRDVLNASLPNVIPAEQGILILNVQTVCAIYEAVIHDKPANTRYITAADLDNRTGKVLRVRLGTSVYDKAREVLPGAVNIYTGGGMMNARLASDDAVIDEKTNFLAVGQVKPYREALCSQCDLCSAYCPMQLRVREIGHYVDGHKTKKAALLHPERCIECALCSYVCLAGRDQAGRLKIAKKALAKEQSLC